MSRIHPPAKSPCGSCPYRQDVPSGVWDEDEYAKLPLFDKETFDQPPSVFMCHQQDGRLCAGWVAVHDMINSFGLRMALRMGRIDPGDVDAIYDYSTTVPLFRSGADAAEHGLASVHDPDEKARRIVRKLVKTKNVGQRQANADLAAACVRCGERYPLMFRFGDEIFCKTPDACRKIRPDTVIEEPEDCTRSGCPRIATVVVIRTSDGRTRPYCTECSTEAIEIFGDDIAVEPINIPS